MKLLLCAQLLLCAGCAAFAPVAAPRGAPVARRAEPRDGEIAPKKKGIPLALLIWPLVAARRGARERLPPASASRPRAPPARSLVPRDPVARPARPGRSSRATRRAPPQVGADIYVSQVQPRLAEVDIATPALPLVPMKPYGKKL